MTKPPFTFTALIVHLDAAKADAAGFAASGNHCLAAIRLRDAAWVRRQIEALNIFDNATPMFAGEAV